MSTARVLHVIPLMLFCVLGGAQTATEPTLYIGPPDKGGGDAHIVLKKSIQDLGTPATLVVREPADFGALYEFAPEEYITQNNEYKVRCSFSVSIYRENDSRDVLSYVGHGDTRDAHSCLERSAWEVAVKVRDYFQEVRKNGG